MKFTLLDAAKIIQRDYQGWGDDDHERLATDSATMTLIPWHGRMFLVCQGTSGWLDWIGNFRFAPKPWRNTVTDAATVDAEIAQGEAEHLLWHGDWIREANEGWTWLDGRHVDAVLGHSRGAGVGSPIALTRNVPGIFFAAPRSMPRGQRLPANRLVHYCHPRDAVSRVVPGWEHPGRVEWHRIPDRWFREAHRVHHWSSAIENGVVPNDSVELG